MDELIEDRHDYVLLSDFLGNLQKSEITLSLLLPREKILIIPRVYSRVYLESECFYLVTASRFSNSIKLAKKIVINFLHLQLDYSRNIELVKDSNEAVRQVLSKPNLSEGIEIYKIKSIKENENAENA